ncbi:MAG TPA: transglutaminase-like domain-containing protein [Pyrinomonadaceae bacterium]|nr:transglutaminase-like domain-containing protein [Pyrinomonadaceae bacterium]
MSDLFESSTKRSIEPKAILIGVAALLLLVAVGYGLYWLSIPKGPDPEAELAVEIRDTMVYMLDYQKYSGDEFRQQLLGKGRLERYKKVIDEAIFTYPKSSDEEFLEFVNNTFWDIRKVDFGTEKDGELILADYKAPSSERFGRLFRTTMSNIKIDHRKTLSFPYKTVTYSPTLEEIKNFTNNSQVYGGRVITKVPERSFLPTIIFANHGIMVAKPGEPSLKRLADDLLKDAGTDRYARIQALVDFVSNEIEYSYSEALSRGETLKRGSETLMTRNGDCSNKTILLASLLEQINEEYVLLYTPRHITVAVPQNEFVNDNKLDFTWEGKNWLIAETTVPGFQVGKSLVTEPRLLTTVEYVQNPKNAGVIFDANSYEVLKFL